MPSRQKKGNAAPDFGQNDNENAQIRVAFDVQIPNVAKMRALEIIRFGLLELFSLITEGSADKISMFYLLVWQS